MSDKYKTETGKLYYVTITVVGWIDIFTRKEYVYELMESQNEEYQFWQNGNHPIAL